MKHRGTAQRRSRSAQFAKLQPMAVIRHSQVSWQTFTKLIASSSLTSNLKRSTKYTPTFPRSLVPICSETCSHVSSLVGDTAWCSRNRHLSKPVQPSHILRTNQGNSLESLVRTRYPVQQLSWHAPLSKAKCSFINIQILQNITKHFCFDLGTVSCTTLWYLVKHEMRRDCITPLIYQSSSLSRFHLIKSENRIVSIIYD